MFNFNVPSLSAITQTDTTGLTSLSSLVDHTQSVLISARAALSSVTTYTPYEMVKLHYCGQDYKYPTIDDIKVPENVSLETMRLGLERTISQHHDKILHEFTEKETPITNFENYSMLSELSSNGEWITTPDKYRKYIEFFEVLGSIDVKSLTSAEIAQDVARKFTYVYLQALTQKTIKD